MSRDLRVADFVRDEVSRILQRDMRDPRVGSFVNVNDVKVSKDLSYADIYVSSLQGNDAKAQAELVAVLNRAAGFFRTELAKRHTMRTTPSLGFITMSWLSEGRGWNNLLARRSRKTSSEPSRRVKNHRSSRAKSKLCLESARAERLMGYWLWINRQVFRPMMLCSRPSAYLVRRKLVIRAA